VDAHASQYGTPTRLLHAVRAGLVEEGWAIDEETMIEVGSQGVVVTGLGSAYNIRRQDGMLTVEIHEASSPGGIAG
jgi:cyanophycinase-like exopeptidase